MVLNRCNSDKRLSTLQDLVVQKKLSSCTNSDAWFFFFKHLLIQNMDSFLKFEKGKFVAFGDRLSRIKMPNEFLVHQRDNLVSH